MPIQRLSLFSPLPSRKLESVVSLVETLASGPATQFKKLTRVFKDDTAPQGRRPADFLRITKDISLADVRNDADTNSEVTRRDVVMEVIDAPEINNKKLVTSRIVHRVPCTQGGNAVKLALAMAYTASHAFFEQGYTLWIGAIEMRIYQVFKALPKHDHPEMKGDEEEDGMEGHSIVPNSATWIVQADVEARTGAPDDLKKGMEDLLWLKKQLHGYLNLMPIVDALR